ncbi:2-oxoacid:ferredoxin oxidoreductase subunit beta [Caldinitratiruptor microaerophilus]|uniref:2-oxoacid:ferredoxin oxidoreductase subunit beta n=1 Tax=Caldinitratiruptor microaerophilus TaxID=671077 RepID=A0AA35G894_9FIRM|nr:2-oxoacid:ferredoxin oxidoreductase subunit beta [Caldinitratiruptor microaerophilus]BDG59044.1 2-oxoacid:ferredoxin oxidoreductase subunit beta [Caldinitratiruptor microaerophilus]
MAVVLEEFKTSVKPTWCPGCGDFGVMNALGRAVASLGIPGHEVVVVSGIGCSGKISQHFGAYGIHTLHGRVLPTATAVKVANRSLTVIAAGGDGDGYGIGVGHLVHAARRNVDITYVVMDNHIYGLTTGQTSPTSDPGMATKTHPRGAFEEPVHPLALAIVSGATFVAQGFSGDVNGLARILAEAIRHPGFALVNVFSPCVTFNKVNTYAWYRESLTSVDGDPDYDPSDRMAALSRIEATRGLVTGILYRSRRPTFESQLPGLGEKPLAVLPAGLSGEDLEDLLAEFE